ncbi:MAG: zf-HC2 domain-containing protein [Planctomycetota bacterium]|nr:zf-HC2 domain-containing protein [Planctomycetota bacterium]
MDDRIRARCDCFYQVLSDYIDGELSEEEAGLVREHLLLCPPCLVYLEQFRIVHQACGKVESDDLPADFDVVMQGVMTAWRKDRCGDPEPGS